MHHILLISFLYEPTLGGGAATVPYLLARQLVERGNQVSVLTSSPDKTLMHENVDGICLYRIPNYNLYWVHDKENKSGFQKTIWQFIDIWNPWVYRITKEIIIQIKPEIIHVHKLRGLSPSVWNAALDLGIPVIHTCHDYELISPQGTLSGRIGQMAVNQSWLLRPYQSIRRKASKFISAFTAPSLGLLQTHLDLGFFPQAVHTVIPNSHGYSQAQLATLEQLRRDKKLGDPLRLLYLGRIHPEKGIQDLLKAFNSTFEVNDQLVLDIAGDGPELPELKLRYEGHHAINFHGHVTGEEKENLLSGCDLLVFPSIVKEGLGIAIIESLAHGKPVISTRCGGPEEIIEEGITGFFVDSGKPEALKEKILLVYENREKLLEMRAACHKTAQKYSIENNVESYLSLYQRLVNG